ncbi:MAG TPA: hypothetical protein VGV40_08625 [Solirubrobacteraceae bacterium]|nr:hypothetical protein [Solirubrobacteraceae bacterium]
MSAANALRVGSAILAVLLLLAATLAAFVMLAAFASDDVYDWQPDPQGWILAALTLGWQVTSVIAVASRRMPRRLAVLGASVALMVAWLLVFVSG